MTRIDTEYGTIYVMIDNSIRLDHWHRQHNCIDEWLMAKELC